MEKPDNFLDFIAVLIVILVTLLMGVVIMFLAYSFPYVGVFFLVFILFCWSCDRLNR